MKTILDLGSGEGYFTYLLSKNKKNSVIGVDFSIKNIQISRKRYPKVNYRVMNAERMSFKNKYFDEIYAKDILEHVDNLDRVLKEIKRVIKPGGRLIVSIPYYKSEQWLLKIRPTYHNEIHHVRIFKEKELEAKLSKLSFKILKKKPTGFLQHVLLYVLFKRKIKSKTQTSIGSWRDTYWTKLVFVFMLHFDSSILKTPLKYSPFWIIMMPFGIIINYFGNKIFPQNIYYEFVRLK